MNQQDRTLVKLLGRYLPLAMALPVSTFVGYAFGYWLDKKFGTTYLYLVFLLLGIAAGITQLLRELNKDNNVR